MSRSFKAGFAATSALSLSLLFSGCGQDAQTSKAPDLSKVDAACGSVTPECAPALTTATGVYAVRFQEQFKEGGPIAQQQPAFASFARETVRAVCLSPNRVPVNNPADQKRSDTLASNFSVKCVAAIADIMDMAGEFKHSELTTPVAHDRNSGTRIHAAAVQLAVPKRS